MKKLLSFLYKTFIASPASAPASSYGYTSCGTFTKEDPKLAQRRVEAKQRLKDNIKAGQEKTWTLAPTVLGNGQPLAQ